MIQLLQLVILVIIIIYILFKNVVMCAQIILIDIDDSTSFNTNNLFGNFEKKNEHENIHSNCDNPINEPDYVPPFQTLDVSCTGQDSYEGKQSLIVDINVFSTNNRILLL